jgi:ribosome modulation factor
MAKQEAGQGHNSGLTETQERALFFDHLNKIQASKAELEKMKASHARLFKAAKADGITKKDLEYALRLRSDDSNGEELLEERRREIRIAKWLQHPVGTQMDMFDKDRSTAEEKAFELGKNAGMEGKACIAPYDGSTKQAQAWIKGWHEGQAAIFDIRKIKTEEEAPIVKTAAAPEGASDDDDFNEAIAETEDSGDA